MFFFSRPDIFPKCDGLSYIWRRVLLINTATQLLIQLELVVFKKLVVPLLLHLVFRILNLMLPICILFFRNVLTERYPFSRRLYFLSSFSIASLFNFPLFLNSSTLPRSFLHSPIIFSILRYQCGFFFSFLFPSPTHQHIATCSLLLRPSYPLKNYVGFYSPSPTLPLPFSYQQL